MRVILESRLLPQIENVTSYVISFQVIKGIVAEGLFCITGVSAQHRVIPLDGLRALAIGGIAQPVAVDQSIQFWSFTSDYSHNLSSVPGLQDYFAELDKEFSYRTEVWIDTVFGSSEIIGNGPVSITSFV